MYGTYKGSELCGRYKIYTFEEFEDQEIDFNEDRMRELTFTLLESDSKHLSWLTDILGQGVQTVFGGLEEVKSRTLNGSEEQRIATLPEALKSGEAEFDIVTIDEWGLTKARRKGHAQYFIEELGEGIDLEMVAVPSGEFTMGSSKNEKERSDEESPQHKVTVQPFFIGKFPITQAQWCIVAGLPQEKYPIETNPSKCKGDAFPVERVSWLDAEEFCLRLSKVTGRTYRLPSEAEWEYACRAGTQTPFYFGETITGNTANYFSDVYTYRQEKEVKSHNLTTLVGKFPSNAFGLYDMHGNVGEWCQDLWHKSYDGAPNNGSAWLADNDNDCYVIRGGSWNSSPGNCRSAYRERMYPDYRDRNYGFRVVCSTPRTL